VTTATGEYGIPGLSVAPGDHVCAFYFGVEERDAVLLPYLRAGLQAGDTCICVVDATEPQAVLDKIGDDVDVDGFVASNQLDVRPTSEAYLRTGRFSMEEMIQFFEDFVVAATEGGGGARIAGEGAWVSRQPPGADEFIDYESELNRLMTKYPQMILCLYDLLRLGGGMVVDLLRTHPKILLGGLVLENPHYLTPDEFRALRA
jgi:DcmR-like sensory protein